MIGGAEIAQFPSLPDTVAFHRTELSVILGLYGRAVAAGLWRDYGISMLRDAAVFSIFRHSAEHPIYRIEKRPRLAARQGAVRGHRHGRPHPPPRLRPAPGAPRAGEGADPRRLTAASRSLRQPRSQPAPAPGRRTLGATRAIAPAAAGSPDRRQRRRDGAPAHRRILLPERRPAWKRSQRRRSGAMPTATPRLRGFEITARRRRRRQSRGSFPSPARCPTHSIRRCAGSAIPRPMAPSITSAARAPQLSSATSPDCRMTARTVAMPVTRGLAAAGRTPRSLVSARAARRTCATLVAGHRSANFAQDRMPASCGSIRPARGCSDRSACSTVAPGEDLAAKRPPDPPRRALGSGRSARERPALRAGRGARDCPG